MPTSSCEVIKLLLADGWFEAGQTGSHKHFRHSLKPGKITVPHPKRDFPIKTLKSIEKASGLKLT